MQGIQRCANMLGIWNFFHNIKQKRDFKCDNISIALCSSNRQL